MSDPNLDADLAAYLAQPVTGERLPSTYSLSIGLVGILQRLAQARGVPVDALVEHALFKAVRADQARRLVDEKPDPIPSSFLDDRVARAKVDLTRDVAAIRAHEERGDKASRLASELEAMLDDASATEPELEAVRRQTAVDEAKIDLALEKKR